MKSFTAILALAAAANASYNAINATAPVYSTTVVPQYTTVCTAGATVSYGPSSYSTVSQATTLTIPNYTVITPVPKPSAPVESKPEESKPATSAPYTPVKPSESKPAVPVYPTGNATVPVAPTGTAAPTGSNPTAPPAFPGSAGKAGLSLFAVAGALAAFL